MMDLNLEAIRLAEAVIADYIHQTPVLSNMALNSLTGSQLYFKCENFQKTGSFKARGASYSVLSLSDVVADKGVVTHSVGNHGGALALAGKQRNIPVTIVVPSDAPKIKVDAIRQYNAEIITCESTMQAREATAERIVEKTGATYIPPFNSHSVMTGQGTLGLELLRQVENLDVVIIPVGGGGLISGVGTAIKSLVPTIEIIGVEPVAADFGSQSLITGQYCADNKTRLITVADGLAAAIGTLTFPIIQQCVDDFITVNDELIVEAMQLIWTRMKIIVEPAASAALAAVLQNPDRFRNKKVALIMTGGNVDLNNLPW
ncbi:MAG TPA: serine dehydratase [Glaciecola sp.]|nr:serine dehydratase [Glaciecola sp.]